MGNSSSNVTNVFKGSSLTGHRIRIYLESHTDIYYIFQYFVIHCAYSKILNANNQFCCLRENIYLSEVSIFSYLASAELYQHCNHQYIVGNSSPDVNISAPSADVAASSAHVGKYTAFWLRSWFVGVVRKDNN